jgi:hypothetical protein
MLRGSHGGKGVPGKSAAAGSFIASEERKRECRRN